MNFKSKAAYGKYLGFVKSHPSIDKPGGGPVTIHGEPKKVDHSTAGVRHPSKPRPRARR